MSADSACPACSATVPTPLPSANPAPHPELEFMTCLECGARLARPIGEDAWRPQREAGARTAEGPAT